MYHIKRMFLRHIEENLPLYIIVLCIFVLGVAGGFVFSRGISEELSQCLNGEISIVIDSIKGGTVDKTQILKTAFFKNLRVFALVFVGGISMIFIPFSVVAFLGCGFSMGFTIGYMSWCFGGRGLAISLISVMGTLLVSVPVYMMYAVIAYNNCRKKNSKGNNRLLYMLISIVLFLVSQLSVFADAFVLPWFLTLTCS